MPKRAKGFVVPNKWKTAPTITIRQAYNGSNSGASKSVCSQLEKKGRLGRIAAELFRIQKTSSRAKKYRGGVSTDVYSRSYRGLAYERKDKVLDRLCDILYNDACGLTWGWARDNSQLAAKYFLYIELPQGQISFHSRDRYVGDNYSGGWDGQQASEARIIEFCEMVLAGQLPKC